MRDEGMILPKLEVNSRSQDIVAKVCSHTQWVKGSDGLHTSECEGGLNFCSQTMFLGFVRSKFGGTMSISNAPL